MRRLHATIALSAVIAASGCVGSRTYVSAKSARYPISMSSAVRGPDGAVLGGDQLVSKGELKIDYLTCRMLWTLVPIKPLTGTRDISAAVNAAVAKQGGEAVINLAVTSGSTVWSVITLVGVLPDCGKVKIRGDIVARQPSSAPPVAADDDGM